MLVVSGNQDTKSCVYRLFSTKNRKTMPEKQASFSFSLNKDYFRPFSYAWIIFLTIWPPTEPA